MSQGSLWSSGLVLALIAVATLRFVAIEWTVSPQYSFGWGVPFLAVYLFWKRWCDRPKPEPGTRSSKGLFAGCLAIGALPLRIMLEANPDWRVLLWIDMFALTASTLLVLHFIGGTGWVRHFFAPAIFILAAAPWPSRAETFLIQTLTGSIAAATVETLNWMGIPAFLQGNIIALNTGALGVNEACSGIRSVQTMLMTAVFFGELNRMEFPRRMVLVVLSLIATIFLNFTRTVALAWIAASQGFAREIAWHDSLGLLALLGSIGLAWTITLLLSRGHPARLPKAPTADQSDWRPRYLSWRFLIALMIWTMALEITNEIWFRSRSTRGSAQAQWSVSWPSGRDGFQKQALTDEVESLLRCDLGESGVWKKSDGSEWTMYFIKWGAGRMAAQLARGHTPDVCMTGSGFHLVADLGPALLSASGLALPFETYQFEANGKPWFVFFCLIEEGVNTPAALAGAKNDYLTALQPRNRLRAVLEGRRFYGQQVFEVAIAGYDSVEKARASFEKALPLLIKVQER